MKNAKKLLKVGLPNYHLAPSDELVETQAAYRLKSNADDTSGDQRRSLKNATFALRRHLLTTVKEPLSEFKKRFPWLFTEDEVRS